MNNYILKNGIVYYNDTLEQLDIHIENGLIKNIDQSIHDDQAQVIDVKGQLISHNFIDIHTHLREPGYEYKETIKTGSQAALYGGYGTIVAMANTQPCMDNVETIDDFSERVKNDACVNVYTYSAITEGLKGESIVDMETISKKAIVKGFSDDGRGVQEDLVMSLAMQLANNVDSIIVAHCEDESELKGGSFHEGTYASKHDLIGINSQSEYQQVERDLKLVKKWHNRYHVCHISTKETVSLLREGQADGLSVSGEVTPHHLILTDENIKDCHPNYKMNPPLRSKEDLDALIQGLKDGTICAIATDHAPHSREEKARELDKAPFGIIGIQHAFPLINTYLIKRNILDLTTVLKALTSGPASVLGINGTIEVGTEANLCVVDLNKSMTITEECMKSKSCNTPFLGVECQGVITMNIVNGKMHQLEEF